MTEKKPKIGTHVKGKPKPPPASVPTGKLRLGVSARRREAVRMRIEGRTFKQISIALKVNYRTGQRYVEEGLELLKQETVQDAEKIRVLELNRIDAMHFAMWPRAIDGAAKLDDLMRSQRQILLLMERRARYVASEIVQVSRTEVTGADGTPLPASYTPGVELLAKFETMERALRARPFDKPAGAGGGDDDEKPGPEST